jgi:hypothetical protein
VLTWHVARAVLSLAALLWFRPFERPLHNVIQAVRLRLLLALARSLWL